MCLLSHPYPSDLSDREWEILAPLIQSAKPGGRPRKWPMHKILNAVFYVLRSSCQWRLLPRDFPPWSAVHHYFRMWRLDGTWGRINAVLRERIRVRGGRNPQPSAGILDTQSVKTTSIGGVRGYDGAKKRSGRKRHLLVDTLGMVLKAKVHAADLQDRAAVPLVLEGATEEFPRHSGICLRIVLHSTSSRSAFASHASPPSKVKRPPSKVASSASGVGVSKWILGVTESLTDSLLVSDRFWNNSTIYKGKLSFFKRPYG